MGLPHADRSRETLEEAQELVYDAWDSEGAKRLRLARKALDVSEDCADAYVILALAARSAHEARVLYAEGVRAGERTLGPTASAHHYWGDIDTRPYMRARWGLAVTLWELGKQREAIDHANELLQLNPSDNQGVRNLLAAWLQVVGEEEALRLLLVAFESDDSTWLSYARALLAFSREGASVAALAKLQKALAGNEYVPDYLSAVGGLPKVEPEYYSPGSREEAILYAMQGKPAWKTVEGALEWMVESSAAG